MRLNAEDGGNRLGIVTGAFGGATIARALAPHIQPLPLIGPYSTGVSLFVVIAVITYVSLIFGELVPQKIALNNPEPIAYAIAIPMRIFSKLFLPLVRLLSLSTELVFKVLKIQEPLEQGVTEEENPEIVKRACYGAK